MANDDNGQIVKPGRHPQTRSNERMPTNTCRTSASDVASHFKPLAGDVAYFVRTDTRQQGEARERGGLGAVVSVLMAKKTDSLPAG